MATTRQFFSRAHLLEMIREGFAPSPITGIDSVYMCKDERNGWETHMVILHSRDDRLAGAPGGFSNISLENLP